MSVVVKIVGNLISNYSFSKCHKICFRYSERKMKEEE